MKSLFEQETTSEIITRINQLKPESQRHWGKMDVGQMLAHCNAAMEVANAKKFPPQLFIGKLIGRFFKGVFLNEKPLAKNTPTDKSFVFTDARHFETEKQKLISQVQEFMAGGAEKCTTHPHAFFGKLNPPEWAVGMYKHLDHHLRQFGV